MCWSLLQSDELWANIIRSRVIRDHRCITHHISSSIWSGVKAEFYVIKDNCSWNVGDGKQINFWSDSWCGQVLVQTYNLVQSYNLAQTYNLPDHLVQLLPRKLDSYITDHTWNISEDLNQYFPNLRFLVSQVTLPSGNQRDKLVWKHSPKGDLTQKDAYAFKKYHFPKIKWAKLI